MSKGPLEVINRNSLKYIDNCIQDGAKNGREIKLSE